MIKNLRQIIRESINELDGISFEHSERYTENAKIFFQDRYFDILSKLPSFTSNNVGLEVGLAGGVLALALEKAFHFKKLYTLEHPSAFSQYTKQFLEIIKRNNILLEKIDLRNCVLPWADNTFDFIVFSEVIEHLVPSDLPSIIKEFRRILKKGALLLVTTPNIASLLKRINLIRGKNPIEFDLRLHEGATYGHIREYTAYEVATLLQENGYTIEKTGYFMMDKKRNIFTHIENFASQFFPSLGNNIIIHARK